MAEKPRIKDTDEIMDSIVTRRGRAKPAVLQGDVLPPPMETSARPEEETAPRRGGSDEAELREEASAPPPEDRNPLDFGKYELPQKPKRRGRPRKTAPPPVSVEPVMEPVIEPVPPPPAPAAVSAARAPAPPERRADPQRSPAAEIPPPEITEQAPPPKPIVPAGEAAFEAFDFVDLEEQERRESEKKAREETARARRQLEREDRHAAAEVERLRKQAELDAERARKQAEAEAEEAVRRAREEAERVQQEAEEAARKAREEAERIQREAEEEAERFRRQAEEQAARLQEEAEEEAERFRRQAEEEADRIRMEKESRRKLLEDDGYREDVLGQLGSQFEQQFSQMFEGGSADAPGPEERPWWLEERREGLGKPVRHLPDPEPAGIEEPEAEILHGVEEAAEHAPVQVESPPEEAEGPFVLSEEPLSPAEPSFAPPGLPPEQERQAEEEAEQFMKLFEAEVLREDGVEDRDADFRETLAEKFMRERERYLRDLGIAEQMEAEEAAKAAEERARAEAEARQKPVPPRRKLDFQIRPELHTADRTPPPGLPPDIPAGPAVEAAPPMTYDRTALARPQEKEAGPLPYTPAADGPAGEVVLPLPPEKKSAEQLLLELGEMNKRRPLRKPQQAQFNFRFDAGEEDGDGEGKRKAKRAPMSFMTRVIILSAGAGLLVLSLLAWGISRTLNPQGNIQGEGDGIAALDGIEDVKELYESFNPDSMIRFQNVEIKKSGLTVSNVTALEKLVVAETAAAEGGLSLNNVIVGELIYIRSSGVNRLELRDVQAERLVINNELQNVTVVASGSTDIASMEVRTPVTIQQTDMMAEAAGIRSMTVLGTTGTEPLDVGLDGVRMNSLSTEGETVLHFTEAGVESITADGALTLSGSGRAEEMNFGLNTGGGAENPLRSFPVSLLVKGVELGRVNVKSPSTLNLNAQVDAVYVSDPVNLGGNGSIGHLVFNEKFGNGRLTADISGLSVQQLTTNAETLFYSSGSSVISTLIANESTWALGNKVNLLKANADGVIYENEPDARQIAPGVEPPQSKAENPNLNYDLNYDFSTDAGIPGTDASGDGVATTCDHARDVGGFIIGDGSKINPFLIETAAQLAHISQHPSSHYLQTADIDIAKDSAYADGFKMIGSDGARFSGVYDGGGYSLQNLRIYGEGDNVGLFTENTGTIRNLHIASGEVRSGEKAFVGGFVGMNLQGGVVENCSNGAAVTAENSVYAGGIAGYNYGGRVRDCYNTGRIVGDEASGGLVGMNLQNASVTGCYNVGVVSGQGSTGAVAGVNEAVVANCYYLESGEMSGIGRGDGNAVAKSATQLASSQAAADLAAGNDASSWQYVSGGSYSYPTLKSPGGGSSAQQASASFDPAASASEVGALDAVAEESTGGASDDDGLAAYDGSALPARTEGSGAAGSSGSGSGSGSGINTSNFPELDR